MTLRKTIFATQAKDFHVLSPMVVTQKGNKRISKVAFFSDFDYTPQPGFLYFTTRAISARVNRNYDGFPSAELKKAYLTFLNRPYFVNHSNVDPTRARGQMVGSKYKEAGKDRYIKLLIEMDATAFPRLAQELASGNLDGVSMGVDVGRTVCSYCNNVSQAPEDFCDHIRYMKGQVLERTNPTTKNKEAILVYETCYDLNFFELSSVFDPADETALMQEVLLPRHTSSIAKNAFGETTAPARVNTLRQKSPCPQCGNDDFDGDQCKWCGYVQPPDELDDPDLDMAQEYDHGQHENVEDGPSDDDDLSQSTGADGPDDLTSGDDGVINPEEDTENGFEGDPNDISEVGPGGNDASDGGEVSPLGEVVHETIKNLEDLLELNQVVQQFADDSSPDSGMNQMVPPAPASPTPMADAFNAPNATQTPVPEDAVPPAATVPADQTADAVTDQVPPDTSTEPVVPPEGMAPGEDVEGAPEGIPGEQDQAPGDESEQDVEQAPEEDQSSGDPIVDQVEELAEGVQQLLDQLSQSDNGAGKEVSAMPTQAKKQSPQGDRAAKISAAQARLKEMQEKLADLSKNSKDLSRNEAPNNGEETVGKTPSPEPATDSTDAMRNDETLTNVQNLDDNPTTREQATKPDKRTNVEVPTVSIANKKARFNKRPLKTARLTAKEFNVIFASCDNKYSKMDLGTALATASREFANTHKVSAKNVLTQVLIAANKRANDLGARDRASLAAFSSAFVRQVKAADDDNETASNDDVTTKADDVLHYYDNGENLDVAKPDDRVDVEAPVANDTNEYAQSSQFDPAKYDHNSGEDIAKPDDKHTMNWAPGEKPRVSGSFEKASAVDAIKLAESYIELGVFSPELKFDKIAEFEKLPKVFVQQQQLSCNAFKRVQGAVAQGKPRGMVPRAATGHRPIPQMGRAATYSNNGSDASMDTILWTK